jgi:Ca2+-binding RTX toxin-like protein
MPMATVYGGAEGAIITPGWITPATTAVDTHGFGHTYIDLGTVSQSLIIYAASSNNTIIGGTGNETLIGMGNHNYIWAGKGDNDLSMSGDYNVIFGGSGNDNLTVSGNGVLVSGGSGHDTITVGDGDGVVVVAGSDGSHIIGGSGHDALFGGAGNDIIEAHAGDTTMTGGGGDDTLIAGSGDDLMAGGSGHDVYAFHSGFGHDTIIGFKPSDVLHLQAHLNGSDIAAPADLAGHVSGFGSVTTITIAGSTIKIVGLKPGDLLADLNHYVKIV